MCIELKRVTDCISEKLTAAVLPHFSELCEIRVRAGRPITVYLLNSPYFVRSDGTLTKSISDEPLVIGFEELRAAFARLCSYSVYKHIENAAHGFITAEGGHRIGVCASAVTDGDEVVSVCDVTSLNIRAAKEIAGCARLLLSTVGVSGGLLLCGAPSSGKTTLLRDIARTLSTERMKKVSIVDERLEIASYFGGTRGFDVGLSDVYSGYPKKYGVMLAVRTMSPDYIICDELTGEDSSAVAAALNCGVDMISAVHCGSPEAAVNNDSVRALMKTGAFGHIAFLDGNIPPTIPKIYEKGELPF